MYSGRTSVYGRGRRHLVWSTYVRGYVSSRAECVCRRLVFFFFFFFFFVSSSPSSAADEEADIPAEKTPRDVVCSGACSTRRRLVPSRRPLAAEADILMYVPTVCIGALATKGCPHCPGRYVSAVDRYVCVSIQISPGSRAACRSPAFSRSPVAVPSCHRATEPPGAECMCPYVSNYVSISACQ